MSIKCLIRGLCVNTTPLPKDCLKISHFLYNYQMIFKENKK